MQMSFTYGTRAIDFTVIFRKRKTMEIRIEPPGEVRVIAPQGVSPEVVLERVKTKARWITEKLAAFQAMDLKERNKEFVNGESFLYLGRQYSLQLILAGDVSHPMVKLYQGKFLVTTPTKDEKALRLAMEQWYRHKASQQIQARVTYYSPKFPQPPRTVKVKDQKKRWGSCTAKNELLFNWRIVMAPAPILDYLVVHEMCHMVHKNHSQDFWEHVGSILPDYQVRREWLKQNGIKLDL